MLASVLCLLCMGKILFERRLEGVIAEVCAGLVLKGRGGRNGIATANLDARKRVK